MVKMIMAVRRLYLLVLGCLFWSTVHCYYTKGINEYETTYPTSALVNTDDGYNCNFTYGLCGWRQAVSDGFDWTLHSGPTPSGDTGPYGDHTTNYGNYLYIETSSGRPTTDYARLEGAYLDMNLGAKCFSFWYNMNGASIGRLSIYTRQVGQLREIWTLSGSQGLSWHHAQANVYGNGPTQLVIEATEGFFYYGDIAIDDTELIDGTCPVSYEQTTFNSDSWTTDYYPGSISVRLVNGPNNHSGLVQVSRKGGWGTICDDEFDHNDVMVICRMLGMYLGERYGRAYPRAYFGQGSGAIFIDDLGCYGYENDLYYCNYNGWGASDCDHSEDVGVDCYANYELTTEYPRWIHQTSSQADGTVRLVGGNYYSGRVEVYSNGQWGTICDDSFDHNDVKVICRMLNIYQGESYGIAYPKAYYGSGTGQIIIDDLNCYGYEADIKQCQSQPWYRNNCNHGEDAGVNCYAYYNEMTSPSYTTYPWRLSTRYFTTYSTSFPWWTTTYNPWWTHYTIYGYKLQDAMAVNCNEYTWNIKVDMDRLRQIYPDAKGSDIYMGENKCTGIERNGHLTFQQGLTECLTSETLQNGVHVYSNELIYAEHDPVYLFIIRHYNWTVGVECDVRRDGSVAGVVNNNEANTISPSVSSQQYPVNMSFYFDPNFMKEVSGTPLHADVGEHVYVKVFTTTFDWNARMRVHTCYTKPTPYSSDHMKYYLIKNGCEVDTNTHIISQSTHETRFVFDQFEYTSNHDGIYVFCDTIFCHSSDYSARCRQTCNPVIRRKVVVEKIQADDNVEDADSKL